MDAAVLGDLLARDERRSQPAVSMPPVDREMSYHDFITTAYKSGNVLRYLGLSADATLAVDPAAARSAAACQSGLTRGSRSVHEAAGITA